MYLAARPRIFHRRDTLLSLFWPDLDDTHARWAFAQALRFLRKELAGPSSEVLVSRGAEEIAVNTSALWCDAAAFREHVDAGQYGEALDLYRDDLLNGFFAEAGADFDEWLARERNQLRASAAKAARAFAELREQQQDFTTAVAAARRAVDLSEVDERVLRELLELLDRLGDRAGATHAYDVFARRLAAEYDAEPAAETKLVINRIRARVTAPAGNGHARVLGISDARAAAPQIIESPTIFSPLPSALTDVNDWRVERELGRGGMATVYLARDIKHDRQVALKMLRPEVAASVGSERFLREIQITARLAHPHILPLIDSGTAAGALYLVTPYAPGESLRERLRREQQLPVDEALRITREVASALDYAHRQGVVHRDVKPENILLQDGQALVADFGIALILSAAGGKVANGDGLSPGTLSYMSPEQVAGDQDLDLRTDVYSLGAVLYEMLVGLPPHTSLDRQDLIEKVLTEPVRPVRVLRKSVGPHVDAVLQKALAKLPADRFGSAAAFARELDDPGLGVVSDNPRRTTASLRRRGTWLIAAGLVGSLALGFYGAGMLRQWQSRSSERTAVRRLTIVLPDTAPIAFVEPGMDATHHALAIAPDASMIAYVAAAGNTTMLYTRRLDDSGVRPLIGTEGAYSPFFSPDGRWIAYFANAHLFKVAVDGGRPVRLTELAEPYEGVWLPNGRILVNTNGGALAVVSEQGGAVVPTPVRAERANGPAGPPQLAGYLGTRWVTAQFRREVSFLMLGDTVRRFALTDRGELQPRESAVPPSREPNLTDIVYGLGPLVVAGSHLLYAQSGGDGVVMAVPFDTARMRATGKALPLLDNVRIDNNSPHFVAANDGTLAYIAGRNDMLTYLVLRDRGGRIDTVPVPRSDLGWVSLSRDGRRVLAARYRPGLEAQWVVMDLVRGTITELPDSIRLAIWSPNSRSLLATKILAGKLVTLRLSAVTGQVQDTVLRRGAVFSVDTSETVFAVRGRGGPDAWIVWRDSTVHRAARVSTRLGATLFPRGSSLASLSPSGRWFALTALSNGQWEVFVAPTSNPDERIQITRNGGEEPLWSANENEIVYRSRTSWYAVSVSFNDGIQFSQPRLLFDGPYHNVPGYSHALMPDGHRHLLLLGPSEQTARRIEVVLGWGSALRRLAPRDR